MADTLTITQIGPADHGKRMSLEEFSHADGAEGRLYELEKGVIVVVDIPGLPHGLVVQAILKSLFRYQDNHPGSIFYIAGGSDSAIRMPGAQSERHPDIAVYLSPPLVEGAQPWDYWVPDLVVEVVSVGGEDRDYQIKREEYLRAGVRLYWIIDPKMRTATVLTRRGDSWSEARLEANGVITTPLLPGLEVKLSEVFAVGRG